MEPYAIVFCLLASLAIIELYVANHALKLPLALICIVILTLISGLRWETGNDWPNYIDHYRFATTMAYNEETFEIGYRALVLISHKIGLSYTGFLLLTALFSNAAFVYVFSRLGPVALLTLMFFTSYFLGYMGTQRQTLAAAIVCIGLVQVYDRRFLAGAVLFACAMLFHVTAIVCFAALLVPRRMIGIPIIAVSAAVLGGIALVTGPTTISALTNLGGGGFIISKLVVYTLTDSSQASTIGNIPLASLKRAVLATLFAYACSERGNSITNFVLNLYLLSVALFFFFVSFIPILALRIGLYFTFFENYLIYTMMLRFGGKYWREIIATIGISFSAARLYWSIVSGEMALLVPYKSVVIESDQQRFLY